MIVFVPLFVNYNLVFVLDSIWITIQLIKKIQWCALGLPLQQPILLKQQNYIPKYLNNNCYVNVVDIPG